MIWTAVLGLGLIFALAGDFVLWAKLDEQKQKTSDEHANYLAALNLHNTTAEELGQCKAREECSAEAVRWHVVKLIESYKRQEFMQDRLSALICPMNDHMWKDGRCVKCGRVK